MPSLSVLSMSFAFGSNGELWWAPDGQESSGAGTSEECGECEALLFMAPQDAAVGDHEHVQLLCEAWDAELGDEAQRAPLGVASRDAVLGGPDYVEPAGGAPWGALLGGQDYVEHLGAAPRGAVLGSLDDQNGSGEWLPPKYSNLGAVADSQSDLRL